MTQLSDTPVLHIKQLAFERNFQYLFNHVNCELNPGELLQIRGTNGSGKTTLLRILAGFIEPHEGNVSWYGKSIFQDRESYQQHLKYIGHQNGIKPNLTVYENLQLNCALTNIRIESNHIKQVLEQCELDHLSHTQALYLSAGQLRRLSLTRLLITSASIWVLDEPTTALDDSGQKLLSHLLTQHLAKNGIAIIATHQNLLLERNIKTMQLGGNPFG